MPRRTRSSRGSQGADDPKKRRLRNTRLRRDKGLGKNVDGRRSGVSDEDANKRNSVLKEFTSDLKVEKCDFHEKENKEAHKTSDYELDELIVRRGQKFKVTVTFNTEVKVSEVPLYLQFTIGSRPQQNKGTVIRVKVADKPKKEGGDAPKPANAKRWRAELSASEEKSLTIEVTPAANAMVGIYKTYVAVGDPKPAGAMEVDGAATPLFRHEVKAEPFYLLFNAWCSDDAVYMGDETHRAEYVMNPRGKVWKGSAKNFFGRPWEFGQFDDCVLPVAMSLLDKAELAFPARSSPMHVTRTISKMTNCQDDDGVLEGNWSTEYEPNTTKPWEWSSSVDILEQYKERDSPVQYGQCWVFSAVTTTLGRALGIPTRSVTNYASAHDTDGSNTIDYHWTPEGEPLEDDNDSVWNFHVWNEAFFKRPDLPKGYEGWQAFDGTPQEASEGVMQCGPAPLKAIKEGHVYLPHDTPFIFSEVNGDRVHWEVQDDGSMSVKYIQKASVGRFISAMAPGGERDDLTLNYKYPEGSEEERKAVALAFSMGTRAELDIYNQQDENVSFDLDLPEGTVLGEDFDATVVAKSSETEDHVITGRLTAVAGKYTGVATKRLFSKPIEIKLPAGKTVRETVRVTADQYQDYVTPDSCLMFFLRLTVKATGQVFFTEEDYTFMPPPPEKTGIDVQCPDEAEFGEDFEVVVKLKNWLSTKMTNSKFHATGSGLLRNKLASHRKSVEVGGEVKHAFKVRPYRAGQKELLITFRSDQAPEGLQVSCPVYVSYPQ